MKHEARTHKHTGHWAARSMGRVGRRVHHASEQEQARLQWHTRVMLCTAAAGGKLEIAFASNEISAQQPASLKFPPELQLDVIFCRFCKTRTHCSASSLFAARSRCLSEIAIKRRRAKYRMPKMQHQISKIKATNRETQLACINVCGCVCMCTMGACARVRACMCVCECV